MQIATSRQASPLTRHAAKRAQQRAIPALVLDLLLDYGDRFVAGGGTEIVRMGQRSRAELADDLPSAIWREHGRKLQTAYAVVAANGAVVTVGHRFCRVERH